MHCRLAQTPVSVTLPAAGNGAPAAVTVRGAPWPLPAGLAGPGDLTAILVAVHAALLA